MHLYSVSPPPGLGYAGCSFAGVVSLCPRSYLSVPRAPFRSMPSDAVPPSVCHPIPYRWMLCGALPSHMETSRQYGTRGSINAWSTNKVNTGYACPRWVRLCKLLAWPSPRSLSSPLWQLLTGQPTRKRRRAPSVQKPKRRHRLNIKKKEERATWPDIDSWIDAYLTLILGIWARR